jgi:hypothetical protein
MAQSTGRDGSDAVLADHEHAEAGYVFQPVNVCQLVVVKVQKDEVVKAVQVFNPSHAVVLIREQPQPLFTF